MIDRKIANKLKAAGVPSDVILDLLLDEDEAAPEAPAAAPPKSEETKAPAPEEAKTPAAQQPDQDPVLAAIVKLTGAIQASNILRDSTGSPKTETVDDILARLIAPEEKGVS